MATTYVRGRGSVFSISVDGGTNFVPIKQIKTTQYSGEKANFEDITNMDSTGQFLETVPTTIDPGQVAISAVFFPSDPGQLAFNSAFLAQTLCHFKHQYAPASGQTTGFLRTFNGYVQDNNLDAQFDKVSTISATVKITGPITDTPGT